MPFTDSFKYGLDLPQWRPRAQLPNSYNTAGQTITNDLRSGLYRDPFVYFYRATNAIDKYNVVYDEWAALATLNQATLGVAAGAWAAFCPSGGLFGSVTGTPTVSSFGLGTLTNSNTLGQNSLADRGDGRGYVIRVVGRTSGKTEERFIAGNTAGTAPTVVLSEPLSFIPNASTDQWELLSGALFLLGSGTTASNTWVKFDIAGERSVNLANTNLAGTIGTTTDGVVLDEQYVPFNRKPGEGFLGDTATYDSGKFRCLQATAAAAGTITGQLAGGDSTLGTNEYRNFQIRIVEDVSTPLANGQRRVITSHTAGASPVYTLSANWGTQPSANAKYVLENNNDVLIWTNAAAVTYSYRGGFFPNAEWSVATLGGTAVRYANPANGTGVGAMAVQNFGISRDMYTAQGIASAGHSLIYRFRGNSTNLDVLDIAGSATGTWTAAARYQGIISTSFATGTCGTIDNIALSGQYYYISVPAINRTYKFNLMNRTLTPWSKLPVDHSTNTEGKRMHTLTYYDPVTNDHVSMIGQIMCNSVAYFDCIAY